MTKQQILEVIRASYLEIDQQAHGIDDLGLESSLQQFGVDSVRAIELAGRIENELQIQLPDDDLSSVLVIGDLVNLIQRQLGASRTEENHGRVAGIT